MGLLTPELLDKLRTPDGRELLRAAEALRDDPFAAEKLRANASAELAAAAVEQVRLRERARAKFADADRMWFASGLLEQASGEVIARHRARRYSESAEVADLCCGLGGDAMPLAKYARVVAVDRDPLALALTHANAEELGLHIETRPGQLPQDAPAVGAAWMDPGRREGGRRTRSLDAMSPSMAEALEIARRIPALGIKLSPATHDAELDQALAGIPHERELLSVRGECRELVVWLGALHRSPRRATLLPRGDELIGSPIPIGAARPAGGYLLEPDAAVIRAGLVGNLAAEIGAWPVDSTLAYLSSDMDVETPFATTYRISTPEPFSGKAMAARLREMGASDVVIKTRGAAAQPEILRQQLRPVLKHGRPGVRPVVFVTRLAGRPVMIFGERVAAGTR